MTVKRVGRLEIIVLIAELLISNAEQITSRRREFRINLSCYDLLVSKSKLQPYTHVILNSVTSTDDTI